MLALKATLDTWAAFSWHFTWHLLIGPVLGVTIAGALLLG